MIFPCIPIQARRHLFQKVDADFLLLEQECMQKRHEQIRRQPDALRLLVIRSGAIGDTIVMSVVYQALRRHFPSAYIEAIGPEERLQLINLPGLIDRITSIERADIATLFSSAYSFPSALTAYVQQFNKILVYSFDQVGVLMTNLQRIHPEGLLRFDPFPNNESNEHITHYLLNTLKALGIEEQERVMPQIAIAEKNSSAAKNEILKIAVHPGSGSLKKNWPVESFIDLCLRLVQAFSVRIHLVIGPAEQTLVREFTRKLSSASVLKLLVELPLSELAHELQNCALYIGNDSGISHLAAALDVPTIAIFSTSNPAIWQPVGKDVLIFHDRSASGGAKITVDPVYSAAVTYLSRQCKISN
ncbi:hypothetical protein U27_04994 [Candidatus Vecturithrix granuli]|uniref:Glycosyl transferase family 9 n=1 Tax=Vecturithrix granuli TaxID=1499967 RepID=A0A081C0B6_VECG1|nr:hypothetical protein U27_04994 [Candidatus Vecturithrix granuli]